jgi:hypothetical protein
MTPRARPTWLVVPALLLAGHVARAGSADAEAAFRAGRKAMQAGDYATACARFAESERLEPAPGTLLNLADCEEHSGHLVAAHEHFGLAASGFPRGDVRRTIALQRESELDKRLVRLTLRLAPSAPQGAVVHDGDTILSGSALGSVRLVDPGLHVVIVAAPGHEDHPYALTLREGDQVEQTLEAGEVSAPGTPPVAPSAAPTPAPVPVDSVATSPAPASSGRRTIGFVLGGVGVAGLAVGTITGILALDRASTVKSHCPDLACDPQGLDAASQGKWLAPTSTVAFIAGGALLAGGAYLVFFGGRSSSAVALTPTISPHAGGAVLRADF